ncbi:EIF1A-like protein [Mya arenaria]|uniref:Probable RNA-binding protein EIF1AD n=1 Tax=Mya arenaria TaxID=6604 RepID=A0ABY7F8Z5_MYAAR|nr:EIF1A-like protein [Mya arenaria]
MRGQWIGNGLDKLAEEHTPHRCQRHASPGMSAATKRKHVVKEVLDDFVLPEGSQQIVRVVASKGNNLHEVETDAGTKFLVSMPTKFRKNVWIKRGTPSGFQDGVSAKSSKGMIPDDMLPPSDSDSDSEPLGDRVVNSNRPPVNMQDGASSSEED